MRGIKSPEVRRNMGFWNENTQRIINESEVGIAGTGGAGYLFALELARLGVSKFVIADPEVFDDVNVNRVMGAREDTIGKNKSEVLRDDILAINSEAKIRVYQEGVNVDNIEEFMHSVDLVLNATELSRPELGTMVCRQARNRMIKGERSPVPVLDIEYIAHAGQGTAINPNSKYTFERIMGLKGGDNAPLDEIADQTIDPSRYLAYIPPYGDIRTLVAIKEGAPLPSNMIGAGVATQIGVAECVKHLRNQRGEKTSLPIFFPKFKFYDAYTGRGGVIKHPRLSYYRGLAVVGLKNVLGLNEKASYTKEERANHGDLE